MQWLGFGKGFGPDSIKEVDSSPLANAWTDVAREAAAQAIQLSKKARLASKKTPYPRKRGEVSFPKGAMEGAELAHKYAEDGDTEAAAKYHRWTASDHKNAEDEHRQAALNTSDELKKKGHETAADLHKAAAEAHIGIALRHENPELRGE